MRHFRSLRRVAVGVVITGAALGAVPALAGAASTCTYGLGGPGGISLAATVLDGSGSQPLRVLRAGRFIAVQDGTAVPRICTGPTGVQASITNTDFVVINGGGTTGEDRYVVDQRNGAFAPGATPESDGTSEIETLIGTNDQAANLTVHGTDAADTLRVGSGGGVMIGPDSDTDVRLIRARKVVLFGNGGGDFLSGRGGDPSATPPPATTPLSILGGDGNDTLIDGVGTGTDDLRGEAGDDILFAVDGHTDVIRGGPGFDRGTRDKVDGTDGPDLESETVGSVGRLRLAPAVVRVAHGRTARLRLSWTHPKSWRALRTVELRVFDGGQSVGKITARPGRARLAARGAVELKASACKLSVRGKTVTARLALRLPKSLAGKDLRVDVQATDRRGRTQFEPGAGLIHVG
jgi:hypothetical protein